MVKKSFEMEIEPQILEWMLRTSGYNVEDINKKLKLPANTVEQWIQRKGTPTFAHIEKMSKIFKRPLASFLLSKAPDEPQLPPDRRSLPTPQPLSPKAFTAIRTARWVQSVAEGLMTNLKVETKPQLERTVSTDDPYKIAERERATFGISVDEQIKWTDSRKAFEIWRTEIEKRNIIILHIPMPIDEIRGFSLTDKEPYVIAVSSSDDPNAKIFTLFHEYAHIILKDSSMCTPLLGFDGGRNNNYESWCDSFAGSFLLPDRDLKNDLNALSQMELAKKVTRLSNNYKVSKYATLVRLRILGSINVKDYTAEVNRLKSKKKKLGFGQRPPPPKRCVQEKGRKFVSLVLANTRDKQITHSAALDYLAIKTRHLNAVRAIVGEK